MKRYHRIAHWYVWVVLCVMLSVGFSIGLLLKQGSPPVSQQPWIEPAQESNNTNIE